MPPSSAAAAAAAASHVPHARPTLARARHDLCARRCGSVRQSAAAEGPSCLFVGPIETASKEMLEALYQQVVALASVWILLLIFGSSAIIVPVLYAVGQAFNDAIHSRYFFPSRGSPFDMLMMLNAALFIGLGYLVGYPVASASVQALQGLWGSDLVALKGSCPNCGEEVFAFVKAEKSNLHPHNTECHVCESALEFRPKVEQSVLKPGQRWVYGRIYLVSRKNAKSWRQK